MTDSTHRRSTVLALACAAAVGAGLIFAGHAMAQARVAQLSKSSVLKFNPFQPSRTSFVGPLAPGVLPPSGPLVGPSLVPTSTDPGGGGGIPTPGRRPPIRDPFRPPTRSPIAPLGTAN